MPILKLFWFLLLMSFAQTIYASDDSGSNIQEALDKQLHLSNDWKNLVIYSPRLLTKVKSHIKLSSAFLSHEGIKNPKAELIATIKAMHTLPVKGKHNEHVRCRFIARYFFLKEHIDFPERLDNMSCPDFDSWVDINKIESASLVFASGYFKNPASFFGHPVLKFNSKKGQSSSLLDITINNGADVPPNENPIKYIVRGLFGGYEARFSDTKFFQINHEYVESDLRDLWDYELNLSEEQLRKLIYFSWELLGHRFTYYFLLKNCGYFLEDLLQYALGERISPRSRFYTIPSKTFFNLVKTENNGEPLVKNISRTASRHTKLYEKFLALSTAEKKSLNEYLENDNFDDLNISERSKVRVIDTLIDYYTFLQSKAKKDSSKQAYARAKAKLFTARLSTPKQNNLWPQSPKTTSPPHEGNKPSLFRANIVDNSEFGLGYLLRLRLANYDLTDLDEGRVANTKLNIFNLEVVSFDGRERVRRFDIVDIVSPNVSRTGLPGDGGLGWGLRFGFEQADNSCDDCLVAIAAGSVIKAKQLSSKWEASISSEFAFRSNFLGSQGWATPAVGVIGHVLPNWKTNISLGRRFHVGNSDLDNTIFKWENRFGNNKTSNFRLDVNFNQALEVSLGYGVYW